MNLFFKRTFCGLIFVNFLASVGIASETKKISLVESIGELKLQTCVVASKARILARDYSLLFKEWEKLGQAQSSGRDITQSLQNADMKLRALSPQAQGLKRLLLQYFKFFDDINSGHKLQISTAFKSQIDGLNSIVQLIFLGRNIPTNKQASKQLADLLNSIKADKNLGDLQKSILQIDLVNLESSIHTELNRLENFKKVQNETFNAHARPILFASLGTAGFVSAVVMAEPALATGVAAFEALGQSKAFGQVAATAAIASLGATGIDVVNEVAIPLWFTALKDSLAREIPLSCALIKQVEISKEKEIDLIFDAAKHGAELGFVVSGLTLISPVILKFLGGQAIKAAPKLNLPFMAGVGKGLIKAATYVDEVALFTVVGLVAAGGIYEGYELYHGGSSYLSFNGILEKIEKSSQSRELSLIQKTQIEKLKSQTQAMRVSYAGDSLKHLIDLTVCGYLLTHMAHGEFIIALEGEMEEVISALATSSDDAPTGINGATDAFDKMAAEKHMSPLELKLYLLNVKLNLILKSKLSSVIQTEMDALLAMSDTDLKTHLQKTKHDLEHFKKRF